MQLVGWHVEMGQVRQVRNVSRQTDELVVAQVELRQVTKVPQRRAQVRNTTCKTSTNNSHRNAECNDRPQNCSDSSTLIASHLHAHTIKWLWQNTQVLFFCYTNKVKMSDELLHEMDIFTKRHMFPIYVRDITAQDKRFFQSFTAQNKQQIFGHCLLS